MTQTSAFHFESLVWDWPIAIYLFLIGISAGLVTLAVTVVMALMVPWLNRMINTPASAE